MKTTGIAAAATATGSLPLQAAASQYQRTPNILLIVADDLGWRDTSIYGSTFYETPNIDALAASGMLFTDAYSANPLCSPTRASIMTGQYPLRHGLTTASGHIPKLHPHEERTKGPEEIRGCGPSALNYLDPAHYTLGKAMRDAGYATAFFGKWHMGCRKEHWPESHGFEYVKGGRSHPGPPGTNPHRKFYPPWNCDTLKPYPSKDTHVDDYIADLTIDYIKDLKTRATDDGNMQPFFICHWPYSVHAPFQSKPELIEKWKQKVDPSNPQHSPTMAAMIEVLDTNVGRLMQALKDEGLERDTIVIFTSDNGGNMYDTVDDTTPTNNYPLRSGKGNNYEGGTRVPMIVRWPGVTEPGSISHDVTSSVDHYPTILELTGQRPRPQAHKDGVSYVPALRGKAFDRGATICDMPHPVWATYNIPNTFVRMGDWKMYRFWYDGQDGSAHRYELYNVRKDIGETHDCTVEAPGQLKVMIDVLANYYKETGVLGYHPNSSYNHRTIGTWFQDSGTGSLSAKDGALLLQAGQPGLKVRNNFFPPGGRHGFLLFEARSPRQVPITFAGAHGGKTITPTGNWKEYQLSGNDIFLYKKGFLVTLDGKGSAELRNVRVTTADKTEMMRFSFYS